MKDNKANSNKSNEVCSVCQENFVEGFSDANFNMTGTRYPCIMIKGNPIYAAVDFLDLKPEDKVIQIGDKISGSAAINRIDYLEPYVEYKGILKTKLMNMRQPEISELLIFRIPSEEDNYKRFERNYFLGYIILRHKNSIELKVPDHHYNVNRIYQPVFKKLKM